MAEHDPISLYLDGELPPEDEPAVLAHLSTCARCQAELGDLIGLDAALSNIRPALRSSTPRRRWSWLAGTLAAAAAVATVVLGRGMGHRGGAPGPTWVALAEARSVEVRVTDPAFASHRPYRVVRGSRDDRENLERLRARPAMG